MIWAALLFIVAVIIVGVFLWMNRVSKLSQEQIGRMEHEVMMRMEGFLTEKEMKKRR